MAVQQLSDKKLLFSAKEAGEIMFGEWNDTTRKKTYRLLHAGTIEGMKLGKSWIIPVSELQKFKEPVQVEQAPTPFKIG